VFSLEAGCSASSVSEQAATTERAAAMKINLFMASEIKFYSQPLHEFISSIPSEAEVGDVAMFSSKEKLNNST
jgi:hypothetical protein